MLKLPGSKIWKEGVGPRALIYALLVVINVFLWIMLIAFQWEVSLRAREVEYFERQLFPVSIQIIPLPVIFVAFMALTAASIGVIIRDRVNFAERKKLQMLLGQILESLEIGVIVLDRNGAVMLANESARRILLLDSRIDSDCRFPDILQDFPQVETVVKAALQEGAFVKETELNIGSPENTRTVRISTLPLKSRLRKENKTLVIISDVSEEVALQRQMKDAERLSTMGTLAAALAHEIRNPLEALNLNLELLERNMQLIQAPPSEGGKIEKYIRVFDSEISRLAGVVENFLSFARPGDTASNAIRLEALLQQVVELIESHAQSRKVVVCQEIGGEPIIIRGYEDRLKQLFLNLVINGIDAMPDGGRLSIHAETVQRPSAGQTTLLAVVSVQDTGEGILPEKLPRLFEPFFSTRTQGTGLGLTIADRIAREHGGAILVDSVPGAGSRFTVELPVSS
ncbi:MAG: PAS domain-containing protein [Acidobacteria bacterium]|nr:PAS domain-containing protein [Acidobacteriota bacterium]